MFYYEDLFVKHDIELMNPTLICFDCRFDRPRSGVWFPFPVTSLFEKIHWKLCLRCYGTSLAIVHLQLKNIYCLSWRGCGRFLNSLYKVFDKRIEAKISNWKWDQMKTGKKSSIAFYYILEISGNDFSSYRYLGVILSLGDSSIGPSQVIFTMAPPQYIGVQHWRYSVNISTFRILGHIAWPWVYYTDLFLVQFS